MFVLIAYATKHGATEGIAERLAATIRQAGVQATVLPMEQAGDLAAYDAFVIGSAAYLGHWRKEAQQFVRANAALLASRPVWLFSSGPLGIEATDAQGRDVIATAEPAEIAEFRATLVPRDHRVFFGALDPDRLTFGERLLRKLPAGRALLPEGDFRDWAAVDIWATGIARELSVAAAQN